MQQRPMKSKWELVIVNLKIHEISLFRKDIQNEYRKNIKSSFYSEKETFGFEHDPSKVDNKVIANGSSRYDPGWYKEVVELRKKAGEYRVSN